MKKNYLLATAVLALSFHASGARAVETSFEEDNSLPMVYLNVAVKAGSVTDPQGAIGLTNFAGEMLLRGTRSRTKEQIDLALDQIGAHIEVEARAESLILRGTVLSSQLKPFLQIVREIITEPSFPPREIAKLKSEIVSSILGEEGQDSSLGSRKFNEFLFNGHPYGNPPIGKTRDIESLTREKIAAHYERLFQDPLLLVVGTGYAKPGDIKAWADELAKARPAHGSTDFARVKVPQEASHRTLEIVNKPDRTQTQVNFGQIGIRMTDSDFFPLYLGNYAFGGGSFSARLMTEIRVKRGWSYGAYSYFRHGLQPRQWQVHLFPAAKDTPAALAYALQMVSDMRDHGITEKEYKFSKESLVNNSGFMFNTPKKRSENKLLEHTLDLPDGFMKTYASHLSSLTLAEVNESIRRFIKPDQVAIVVVGTAKDLQQPLAKAAGVSARDVQIVPYTEE